LFHPGGVGNLNCAQQQLLANRAIEKDEAADLDADLAGNRRIARLDGAAGQSIKGKSDQSG
jgi:hypothetical protein